MGLTCTNQAGRAQVLTQHHTAFPSLLGHEEGWILMTSVKTPLCPALGMGRMILPVMSQDTSLYRGSRPSSSYQPPGPSQGCFLSMSAPSPQQISSSLDLPPPLREGACA